MKNSVLKHKCSTTLSLIALQSALIRINRFSKEECGGLLMVLKEDHMLRHLPAMLPRYMWNTNILETAHAAITYMCTSAQTSINHEQPAHTLTVRHTTRARTDGDEKAEQRHTFCHRGIEALGANRGRKQDEGSFLQWSTATKAIWGTAALALGIITFR